MNNHVTLIPVKPDNPYPLGRVGINHDLRNANHRALVQPPRRAVVPYQLWYSDTLFNQAGDNCTIEAAAGMVTTYPFKRTLTAAHWALLNTENKRLAWYEDSKNYDPWEGVDYEGTSTDAPFKLMRERGVISAWKWVFGEAEAREWVTWYGPLVVGTFWYDGMFDPNNRGFLNVTGEIAGGHAYRIVRYDPLRKAYRVVNSWGMDWGQYGRAWLRDVDLASLLEQDGEAVTVG